MLDRFERAMAVTETAKSDGRLTAQEMIWVLAAWLAAAAYAAERLADPTEPVDRIALTSLLIAAWQRVEELLAGVPLPMGIRWLVRLIRGAIADSLPEVADQLAAWLDAAE